MKFQNFEEFWPFYLAEHSNPMCRRFHFAGTSLALSCLLTAPFFGAKMVLFALIFGYGFAWIGHFAFQKNRPATFAHPLWSLRADFRMYAKMLKGELWRRSTAKEL
ncbi:MAG: DUF962 domain-containing protein [Bdellovibrionota bacterium]